jgi:hypothetical protein
VSLRTHILFLVGSRSFDMSLRVWTGAWMLLCLCLWSAGCGGTKSKATVKGQVTIGSKPVYMGTVSFILNDKQSGSATTDQNGNYVVTDAPVGDCKISVTVPKLGPGLRGGPVIPKGMPAMKDPNASESTPAPLMDPSKIVPIPDKYGDPNSSGLSFKVEKGEQTHDIKLSN